MPDLGVNIVHNPFGRAYPEVDQNMTSLIALMLDTKFDSKRTDGSGEQGFGILCQSRATIPEPPYWGPIATPSTT